jgi:ABC-2 type transport system ATP-binding protein
LLYQGPLEALLVGRAVPAYRIVLRSPVEPVVERLLAADWTAGVDNNGAGRLRVSVRSLDEAQDRLPMVLAECGARVVSLAPESPDLEDVFLELTS